MLYTLSRKSMQLLICHVYIYMELSHTIQFYTIFVNVNNELLGDEYYIILNGATFLRYIALTRRDANFICDYNVYSKVFLTERLLMFVIKYSL